MAETLTDRDMAAPVATPDARLIGRRPGRELFPASWLKRGVRIEYEVGGRRQDTRGAVLDFCGLGLILSANGTRLLVSWECLRTVELEND